MNLAEKFIYFNTQRKQQKAHEYLQERIKTAKFQDGSLDMFFDEKFERHCYYYSTFLLLCLKSGDKLVRGKIHLDNQNLKDVFGDNEANYEHGWVEFEYDGVWWVYDDHYELPIPSNQWYETKTPYEIYKQFTQTELIEHIKKTFPDQIDTNQTSEGEILSTSEIYDIENKIPFSYINLLVKDGEIKSVEIDKEKEMTLI